MFLKYNGLGKICFLFVFINLFLAFFLAMDSNPLSILNVLSAFFCHLGTFSNKCKKNP